MKMKTKVGIIATGSVLVLSLAVASFRPFSNAGSASAMKVSLQDMSGKPLSSLFDGMPIEKRYPEFKRLVAERRSQKCGQRQTRASRLLQELGLWIEPVVHACGTIGCSCGYIPETPDDPCSRDCGIIFTEVDLRHVPGDDGIKNGAPKCTALPPPTCPGYIPNERCKCPPGYMLVRKSIGEHL